MMVYDPKKFVVPDTVSYKKLFETIVPHRTQDGNIDFRGRCECPMCIQRRETMLRQLCNLANETHRIVSEQNCPDHEVSPNRARRVSLKPVKNKALTTKIGNNARIFLQDGDESTNMVEVLSQRKEQIQQMVPNICEAIIPFIKTDNNDASRMALAREIQKSIEKDLPTVRVEVVDMKKGRISLVFRDLDFNAVLQKILLD